MNLGEMRNLAYTLADEAAGAIFTTASVNRFVNLGIQKVARSVPANQDTQTVTLADGVADYELSDPLIEGKSTFIHQVRYDGVELPYISPKEIYDITTEGRPTSYYDDVGSVFFYPVPSSTEDADTILVDFEAEMPWYTSDENEPPITVALQELAVFYAVYLMKMKDDEHDAADRWQSQFDGELRKLAGPRTGVYSIR